MITEEDIFNFCQGKHRAQYFVNHILIYLRENTAILEENDYLRLYNECVDFLIWKFYEKQDFTDAKEHEKAKTSVEFIADLISKRSGFEPFSASIVENFLSYRKKAWKYF